MVQLLRKGRAFCKIRLEMGRLYLHAYPSHVNPPYLNWLLNDYYDFMCIPTYTHIKIKYFHFAYKTLQITSV